MSDALMKHWAKWVAEQSLVPPYIEAGSQSIYQNLEWTIPASMLLEDTHMQPENIGFTPTKIRMLKTHYENLPTIERAKRDLNDRIRDRKYGSGVWDFRGVEKKTTKQDYCLTAGVIALYPQKKHTSIFIRYRTVELIFRYRADLVFLRDVIFPHFDLQTFPPDTITFSFVNATIHPMFYVMLLLEHKAPGRLLEKLAEENPRFHHQIVRWTRIHLSGGYKTYQTAQRVQKFVATYPEKKRQKLSNLIGVAEE
jgi:hypothetical protein